MQGEINGNVCFFAFGFFLNFIMSTENISVRRTGKYLNGSRFIFFQRLIQQPV